MPEAELYERGPRAERGLGSRTELATAMHLTRPCAEELRQDGVGVRGDFNGKAFCAGRESCTPRRGGSKLEDAAICLEARSPLARRELVRGSARVKADHMPTKRSLNHAADVPW